jgi:hypothetical protein
MPDVINVLNGDSHNLLNLISAGAALGTAAMGLVDALKVFGEYGPSIVGFGDIRQAIGPFIVEAPDASTVFGRRQILQTLKANWLNGVAKHEQKAKAKALVHLGLTQGNAAALARAAGVDAAKLTSLAQKTANGATPTQDEINVLGQFDAVLSAVLDTAYERADQRYRNAAKVLAMFASLILGVIGGWLVYGGQGKSYLCSKEFFLCAVIGLAATPLAPVAKDLASALQAAMTAARAVRR